MYILFSFKWFTKRSIWTYFCFSMTIVEFPRPRLVVTLLPNTVSASSLLGSVLVKAVDLHPVVDMHIQYLTNWG